jgi:iron complex outermembrane receptor protein
MKPRKQKCFNRMLGLLALILAIMLPLSVNAQTGSRTIRGTVVDENQQPLIGVSVMAVGSSAGVATDLDGNYLLKVPTTVKQITFSYIGYETKTVTITSDHIDVALTPNSTMMEELVVVGYGVQKKNDLTGSISSVSEKDFNQGVISSPEELINGKIAGVQITNSGGSPNSSSTIRVRGGASLNASNDPLIVLDGVPMEVGGSVAGSSNFLSLINPNDIESMTILKDASSTAIYGSRASNGVIIITTKKGTGDGVKVSFQTTNSISNRTKTAEMLSASQFRDVYSRFGTEAQQALVGNYNTNWNDAVFRSAFGTDNNLSVAGRAAKWLPFRVSLGANYQDGILKTDNSRRFTANVNLNPSFFEDHLRVTVSGKATVSRNRFAETGAVWNASAFNPTVPVYDETCILGGYNEAVDNTGGPAQGSIKNPLGMLEQYKSTSNVQRYIGNIDLDYRVHFLPDLRLHATGGYDYSRGKGHIYLSDMSASGYNDGGSDYDYGTQKNYNRLLTIYANYNKDLDAIKSTLDVTAGYDYQYWRYYYPENTQYTVAGDEKSVSSASDERHTLLSYYGRVNYTLMGNYLLTATFRRDGSSRFSKDNRWGTFPSVALAWRVANESFWEPIASVMNDFKIRASYGITGQQDGISNYGYLPNYTIGLSGAQYQFGGTPIYTYRPEAYNPDLKWETTKSWNFGVDFGFLNGRINGSVDYYTRKTEDLLATVPVPAGVNFDKSMLTNVGNVDSKGVEIAINANIIDSKDWTWTVTANATWQDNKITNLTLIENGDSPDTPVRYMESTPIQYFSTGYAPYSYLLYKQIYDETTGKPIEGLYADLNGDGQITDDDRYHTHSPAPDWIFGFSTSLRYQKWTLSTSLRANVGNYVYNGMAANMGAWECTTWCGQQINNLSTSFLETEFQNRQYASDYYLENASFLKMDNIQLSYDFGRIYKSLSLHASAMVQNVFTITKYSGVDPENVSGIDTSSYPRPRTYSLTLGLNF